MQQVNGFAETIPNRILRKLRESVAPPGKRGTWLRYLDDDRLAEVFVRLQSGTSCHHIASVAQKEWGIKPSSKTQSLARAVRQLKDKMIGDLEKLPVRNEKEKETQKELKGKAAKVSAKINELEETGWVAMEQRKRIQLFRNKEDVAKMGFAATDKAIQVYLQILELYAKMKINLGLIEPPNSEFNVNVKHKFAGLMQHTVGSDGAKVVSALDRFVELVDEKSLALTQNAQGAFEYAAPGKKEAEEDGTAE
jgi:hypothetical protein